MMPRLTTNPPKTFNIVCPASILANKRTDKLIGLLKKDIISMTTSNGNKKTGIPDGTNIFKNPNPFFTKPTIVTPINITIAKKKCNDYLASNCKRIR